jgi:hypothetical protein
MKDKQDDKGDLQYNPPIQRHFAWIDVQSEVPARSLCPRVGKQGTPNCDALLFHETTLFTAELDTVTTIS